MELSCRRKLITSMFTISQCQISFELIIMPKGFSRCKFDSWIIEKSRAHSRNRIPTLAVYLDIYLTLS